MTVTSTAETFDRNPVGAKAHPAKAGPPAGSESWVASGQPWLLSVDSERVGRATEPRNICCEGRRRVPVGRPRPHHRAGPGGGDFTGVCFERGMDAGGFPRNLGDPVLSTQRDPAGDRVTNPQAKRRRAPRLEERTWSARVVPPSEGHEARRDGGRESEPFVVPVRPGNPHQGTRWREGRAGSWNHWRER
jgi:hypothetical protein